RQGTRVRRAHDGVAQEAQPPLPAVTDENHQGTKSSKTLGGCPHPRRLPRILGALVSWWLKSPSATSGHPAREAGPQA
ncbi:MAG TPA: hypothetical protein VI997_11610, partial [Candidatus Thermoplasmatota archaeon]|nr:hypothetical protein [Candidatus Thermoplasmatota archaeon]